MTGRTVCNDVSKTADRKEAFTERRRRGATFVAE
jgi:hypothetical protein